MTKERDVNDILREEGEDAVRAYHNSAEPFDESNPKFQKANHATNHQQQTTLESASAYVPAGGLSPDEFVAYMPQHSYVYMPSREMRPAASVNARVPSPAKNSEGKPIAASKWLDANRPVEQMTWAPGKPKLIRDKLIADGGWIDKPGCTVFNLYRPPAIQPIAGDVTPWLDLI